MKHSLLGRIVNLEKKLVDQFSGYDSELLLPERTAEGWLLEGVVFPTEGQALKFAEEIKKDGTTAWLDELIKGVWE